MRKYFLPSLLVIIFIVIGSVQYYENYLFRIQPPSGEWSKEVVVSRGKVKNSPRIIEYKDMYAAAHDDGSNIKIILLDKLGNKLGEKVFPGKDELIMDLNLLTDGDSIYVSWIYSKGNIDNLINLKLDKDFNILEQWEVEDVRASIQVSSNLMAIAHPGRIEVYDINTRRSSFIEVKYPTKLASTKTKDGYMIVFYDTPSFKYVTYSNGILSKPEMIMVRPIGSREMLMGTAVACDDKNGYIIIDRKYKNIFGQTMLITFPLSVDKSNEMELVKYEGVYYKSGAGSEKGLRLSAYTDFTYNPLSVSSGDEARFLIGVARVYGKSERQFDIMDFKFKDGKVTSNTYIDKTREGTTMPWIDKDIVIFCNQTSPGQYDVCIASQNESFKNINNSVRFKEIKLALLDTLTAAANSILALFTIGIRWIVPAMLLISVATLFGFKLSIKNKKIVFLTICAIGGVLKMFFAEGLFYGRYANVLPEYLKSSSKGIILLFIISMISYSFGYTKYKKALNRDPDVLPLFIFILAIAVDSILTQFVYSPYIM